VPAANFLTAYLTICGAQIRRSRLFYYLTFPLRFHFGMSGMDMSDVRDPRVADTIPNREVLTIRTLTHAE
jgi:hypothetical protein